MGMDNLACDTELVPKIILGMFIERFSNHLEDFTLAISIGYLALHYIL